MFDKLSLSTAFAGATVLAAATVVGSANVANAATFGFSFSNVDGPVNGTVEGTIELPDGDGTFAATSVFVTSAPAALGYTTPFDVFANFFFVNTNSFTVAGGTIDALNSEFLVVNETDGLSLNFSGGGTFLNVAGSVNAFSGVADFSNSTLVYTSAAASVPEPSTIVALAMVGSSLLLSKRVKRG
jgi:hypothetical protein